MYEEEEDFLEFQKAYLRIIDETNGGLEKIRLNFLKEYKIWFSIGFVMIFISIILIVYYYVSDTILITAPAVVFIIACFSFYFMVVKKAKYSKKFKKSFKKDLLKGLFVAIFFLIAYNCNIRDMQDTDPTIFFVILWISLYFIGIKKLNYSKKFKKSFKINVLRKLLPELNIAEWNRNISANKYRGVKDIDNYIKCLEFKHKITKRRIPKVYIDDEFCGKYKDISYKAYEIRLNHELLNMPHYLVFELKISNNVCFDIDFSTKNFIAKIFNIPNLPRIILLLLPYIILLPFLIPDGYDNDLYSLSGFIPSDIWDSLSVFAPFCFIAINVFYIFYIIKKLTYLMYYVKNKEEFKIYSNNPIAAESILYPAFLQSLNELKFVFKTKNIECKFREDKIVIAIETNKADLFEFGDLHKSVKDSSVIYQFYREIHSIFNIIDALKSN